MQITVKDIKVKEGISKSGKNEGKPWKLVILEGTDGKEYTTFDAKAEELQPGAVIKIDQVTLKTKDNGDESRTFKEFAIVSAPTPGPAPTNGNKGMTPEAWAEKDRLERWSIESQVAFKGVVEMSSYEQNMENERFKTVFNAALDWAMAHFQSTKLPQQPTTKTAPEGTKLKSTPSKPETGPVFKNGADIVNYAIKQGQKWDDIQVKLSISKPPEITDLEQAAKILFGDKPDAKVEVETDSPKEIPGNGVV